MEKTIFTIHKKQPDPVGKFAIQTTLFLNCQVNDHNIIVSVKGNSITLTSTCNSLLQKRAAGQIASGQPGE
jgi:osmotically-inducible protein OsmY